MLDETVPAGIRRRRSAGHPTGVATAVESQINEYIWVLDHEDFNKHEAALKFWERNKVRLSRLYAVALQMLAIPATSAPVERMFSQAGLSASGQRNNITPALVEAEVLLRYNKSLLK